MPHTCCRSCGLVWSSSTECSRNQTPRRIGRKPPDHANRGSTTLDNISELQLSERLRRSLATTNAVESLLSRTRHVKQNVKRWRGGTMVLRWIAAGVLEAAKGFRRVKGCRDNARAGRRVAST